MQILEDEKEMIMEDFEPYIELKMSDGKKIQIPFEVKSVQNDLSRIDLTARTTLSNEDLESWLRHDALNSAALEIAYELRKFLVDSLSLEGVGVNSVLKYGETKLEVRCDIVFTE